MSRDVGYWLGHAGALLPMPGVKGELTRSVERPTSYVTSAGGTRRAYLSARRAPLREWKVTLPRMRPDEAAPLHGLIMATDPPYVWVDPWSMVTNLLTPRGAGLLSTLPALSELGRQPLDGGGWAATGGANPDGVVVRVEPAPVVPGMPVTVSAYLASFAGGTVSAAFLDSAGVQVGAPVTSPAVVGTDVLRRASVTAPVPPVGAAAVEVRVTGASVIAQPAVTWTAGLLPYGGGGGAAQVVVTGIDEAILWAFRVADGKRWADASFTVTEVG